MISPASAEPDALLARGERISLTDIVEAVCAEFHISPALLRQKGNRPPARAIVAHLSRRYSSATLRQIAENLGLARRDGVANLSEKAQNASPGSPLHRQMRAVEQRLAARHTHHKEASLS